MSATHRHTTVVTAAGTALLAALAAFATATPAFAAAPSRALDLGVRPHGGVVESNNWAGYAVDGSTYTSVSASWVVPSLTCASGEDAYSSAWVGLDGFDNSALEQTGTEADCIGGKAEYGAWWEVLPASESVYSGATVRPGDHLTGSVVYNGGTSFTMTLTNSTEGWTKTTTHAGSSGFQNTSAEVISETEAVGGGISQAPDSTVPFSGSVVDGSPLGSFDPTEIIAPDATVSALSNGENFTVRWGSGL